MKNLDRVVSKLIKLTKAGKLSWHERPRFSDRPEKIVGKVYVASHQAKLIAVYQTKYKYYTDEFAWEWATATNIEFIDSDGQLEWTWPEAENADELLDAIRFANSDAQAFMDSFVDDDEDKES